MMLFHHSDLSILKGWFVVSNDAKGSHREGTEKAQNFQGTSVRLALVPAVWLTVNFSTVRV